MWKTNPSGEKENQRRNNRDRKVTVKVVVDIMEYLHFFKWTSIPTSYYTQNSGAKCKNGNHNVVLVILVVNTNMFLKPQSIGCCAVCWGTVCGAAISCGHHLEFPAAPPPIQLLANASGKAMEDGRSAWAPAILLRFQASSFLWSFGESFLFFPSNPAFHIINY